MEEQNNLEKAQKSIYWKVTIILSNLIAIGFVGAIVWAIVYGALFNKIEPSVMYWTSFIIRFGFAILGIWYGVRFIAKRSILSFREATKVAIFVIILPTVFTIGAILYQYLDTATESISLSLIIQNLVWIVMLFVSTKYFIKKFADK